MMGEVPVEDHSELVQDFYQSISDRIDSHLLYKGKQHVVTNLFGPL